MKLRSHLMLIVLSEKSKIKQRTMQQTKNIGR